MSHLVIVDGHHLMYRAYWGIPRTLTTAKGELVNATFGVASMILQILKVERPDAMVFCFDAGEETFRHQEYAEYKKGRAETPDDFIAQIPRILFLIDAFGFKIVAGSGYEADDFACAHARMASLSGWRVTIVSGDRDLLQLASDTVRIAIPTKGYQEPDYFGASEVMEKYGVTPAHIPALKGLAGDVSDNLKGVEGIGPKTAAKLLSQYGTLERLYEQLGELKPVVSAKLEKGKEQAFFCQRMATLVCEMPLPFTLDQLAVGAVDIDRVLAVFAELQFAVLAKRLQTLAATPYGQEHFASHLGSSLASPLHAVRSAEAQDGSAQLSLL